MKSLQTFISYSRVNQQFAIKLASELKSAGFSVWLDQFDIPTGARWDDEIEKALRDCQIFLFIMTPASIASENAKDEVGYAIDHGKHILPVLLADCEIPLRLRRLQYVDFTRMSFNEGIKSAKELLSRLVKETEGSTPGTSKPVKKIPPKGPTRNGNESITSPTRKETYRTQSGRSWLISKWTAGGIGLLIIGILAVVALIFKTNISATFSSPTPIPTVTPTETALPPTDTPVPTIIPETQTPAISRSFMEDFNADSRWSTDWTLQLRHESPQKQDKFKYEIKDGDLNFTLDYEYIWAYFLYKPEAVYQKVEVEAIVADLKPSETFGLVCQYSDQGWYEFDITGGGKYFVRYVDNMDSDTDETGSVIGFGYIPGFKDSFTTARENTMRIICDGENLSLFVNDVTLIKNTQSKTVLEKGQVGVCVRSYESYPIHFAVKSIVVREE